MSRLPAIVLLGLAYLAVMTVSIAWLPQRGWIGTTSIVVGGIIGGYFIINLLTWGKAEVTARTRTMEQQVIFLRRWSEGVFWLALVLGLILLALGHFWAGLILGAVALLVAFTRMGL